jgi:hypothetical protein
MSGTSLRTNIGKIVTAAFRDYVQQGGQLTLQGLPLKPDEVAAETRALPALAHQSAAILSAYGIPRPAIVFVQDSQSDTITGFRIARMEDLQNSAVLLPAMNLLIRSQLSLLNGAPCEVMELSAVTGFVEFCQEMRRQGAKEISVVYEKPQASSDMVNAATGMLIGNALLELSSDSLVTSQDYALT